MWRLVKHIFFSPKYGSDGRNLRRWFIFFCVYMVILAAGSLYLLNDGDIYGWASSDAAWLIGVMMFYLSLANTFVPLPTSWIILLLASPAGGLPFGPYQRAVLVGAFGALASTIAHLNEYYLITYFLRLGKMGKVKNTRVYQVAGRIFRGSPFWLLLMFNIVPVPADPARWLATGTGYSLGKFFLANWLGRFIRYTLMGLIAGILALGFWQIMIIQAVLVLIAAARVGLEKWFKTSSTAEPEGQAITEE